jgi:hypothetical protein
VKTIWTLEEVKERINKCIEETNCPTNRAMYLDTIDFIEGRTRQFVPTRKIAEQKMKEAAIDNSVTNRISPSGVYEVQ